MARLVPLLFSDEDGLIDPSDEVGPFDINKTASIKDVVQLMKIKDWAIEHQHDLEDTPLCHQADGKTTSAKSFVAVMRELEVQRVDGVVVENPEKIAQAGWQTHFISELERQNKKLYSALGGPAPVEQI